MPTTEAAVGSGDNPPRVPSRSAVTASAKSVEPPHHVKTAPITIATTAKIGLLTVGPLISRVAARANRGVIADIRTP